MPCTIPFGRLAEKYSVQWFKGLELINPSAGPRITLDRSSLVFSNVVASDNGNGYYCVVSVNSMVGNATRIGATISLVLEGTIDVHVVCKVMVKYF